MLRVRVFTAHDRVEVVELWRRCDLLRPWNDPDRDIDRKLAADPDGFLVGEIDGVVVASAMVGYDGHRGWVNYLAVDPDRRSGGHGAELMAAAEELLRGRGCPKLNVQIRTGNAGAVHFYESIGYELDDVVSMGRRLIDDTGTASHG